MFSPSSFEVLNLNATLRFPAFSALVSIFRAGLFSAGCFLVLIACVAQRICSAAAFAPSAFAMLACACALIYISYHVLVMHHVQALAKES